MPSAPPRPSPSGLTVLALLGGGPLHPYGMQRLIKTWGKDQVVNIGQRANLYKTIRRLHEAGALMVGSSDAGIAPVKPHDVARYAPAVLRNVGFGPAEALRAVTSVPAAAIARSTG